MSFPNLSSSTTPFPIYLLPSISFRHRRAKPITTTPSVSSPEAPDPLLSNGFLSGHDSQLRCARCATDLCSSSQIISKGFTGRHGRAFLVSASPCGDGSQICSSLPNTRTDKAVPRQLVTGAHTVSDVICAFCDSVIGWKYDAAEEESQRYKVGKFILETKKIYAASCWEREGWDDVGGSAVSLSSSSSSPSSSRNHDDRREKEKPLEFDSQDEDECEDLFAGVWSPALAMKRRQGRRFGRVIAGMRDARC